MGQITLPSSGSVYVDTNAVIYMVERIEPYLSVSAPLWDALNAAKQAVDTSQSTLLEVLVKPLRDGNAPMVNLFRKVLLGTAGLTCWPISLPTLEAAARLRGQASLKTPDAIHAATALEAGC
jgi:predicted nucleic acid-binding protein